MSFTEHPLRRWAVDEMRLRRFAPVSRSCEIYQVVRLIEPAERSSEDRWLINARPDFDDWTLLRDMVRDTPPQVFIFVGTPHRSEHINADLSYRRP